MFRPADTIFGPADSLARPAESLGSPAGPLPEAPSQSLSPPNDRVHRAIVPCSPPVLARFMASVPKA
jgi:hypothetical protein